MVGVGDFDRFIFVAGAPRCGTTSIAEFLRNHPATNYPFVKEPHFFAQHDLRGRSDAELRQRVEDGYLRRFFAARDDARIGADASVTYLYTPEQLEPAVRLWPDSRFIVTVRNPVSMLPSLHQRLLYIGDETIPDFADAWAAVPDRAAGRRIPARCAEPRWLRYDEAPRFATYLERLFSVVGRDKCHLIVFDDLQSDPVGEYRRLMSFAGLQPVPGIDFSAKRTSKRVRNLWLQRLLKRPPAIVRSVLGGPSSQRPRDYGGDSATTDNAVLSLRKRLLRWNRIPGAPAPLPEALRTDICRTFETEIERLELILGRDLSHWLDGGTEAVPMNLRLAQPRQSPERRAACSR